MFNDLYYFLWEIVLKRTVLSLITLSHNIHRLLWCTLFHGKDSFYQYSFEDYKCLKCGTLRIEKVATKLFLAHTILLLLVFTFFHINVGVVFISSVFIFARVLYNSYLER